MLMLLLAAMSDPPAPPTPPAKCERAIPQPVDATAPTRARPLAQEPLAREEKAVAYSENGCLKPVVVREQVGR